MIPLFETNRGCPFGCTYCAWGVAALSKVRQRPLEVVFAEIDYVAENSSGQVNWIFCDANFGMLPRDVEIAKKIKSVCTEKGFPLSVTLWHAKNSGKRNVEILKQAQNDPFKVEDQVAIIYAGSKNLLKNVPVDKIKEFESEYIQLLNNKHSKILKEIKQGKLTEDVINTLEKVCSELVSRY
mgnify:CR=1 FL=1